MSVDDRRNRDRYIDAPSIPTYPDRLEVIDPFSLAEAAHDLVEFVEPFWWNEQRAVRTIKQYFTPIRCRLIRLFAKRNPQAIGATGQDRTQPLLKQKQSR
jgi:hypothetical protein